MKSKRFNSNTHLNRGLDASALQSIKSTWRASNHVLCQDQRDVAEDSKKTLATLKMPHVVPEQMCHEEVLIGRYVSRDVDASRLRTLGNSSPLENSGDRINRISS